VSQRELYNAALEERIDCYRKTGKTRTYIDQRKAATPPAKAEATARTQAVRAWN
jgi:putative transposase